MSQDITVVVQGGFLPPADPVPAAAPVAAPVAATVVA
jgi:hypothetical protein